MLEPGIAQELARLKVARIRESGARIVATGNPGCIMQIAHQCRAEGVAVEVAHPVTVLARALREP
jgi:glycolate oxidase iron-sulfur subunit